MKREKKGFTLIELMVVIVIIGILAAIAIPKLFGMTAKAKAQEVPGAAGTWSKLQAAYIMEQGRFGTISELAYKHPGATNTAAVHQNNNFEYAVGNQTATGDAATATWRASVIKKLNDDCNVGSQWVATYTLGQDAATGSAGTGCLLLTPQFVNLR